MPYCLDSDYASSFSDKIDDADLDIFYSLILCILRIKLRDCLSCFQRQCRETTKNKNHEDEITIKLINLFPLNNNDDENDNDKFSERVGETAGDILERFIKKIFNGKFYIQFWISEI